MTVAFLPAIDLESYTTAPGLSPKALSYIGRIYAEVTPPKIEQAFLHLQQTSALFHTFFDVTAINHIRDVVSLLDSGAAKVFVTESQHAQLKTTENIDLGRVVLSGNNEYIHVPDDVRDISTIAGSSALPIISATRLTLDPGDPSRIQVAPLLLANARSDRPDGLLTTLVTDERHIALGVVYSNEASVAESLRTGRGVYHSRKRGLWRKGESSGDIQELVRIDMDCDSDCLRFVVRQKGRGWVIPCAFGSLADSMQDSATWVQRHVSGLTADYLVYNKHFKVGKRLHHHVLIRHACSTILSC